MKQFLILIALFACISPSAFSQNVQPEINPSYHRLGVAANSVGGYGMSYRYMPKRIGIQINAMPLFDLSSRYRSFSGNIGVSGLFILRDHPWIDLVMSPAFSIHNYGWEPNVYAGCTYGLMTTIFDVFEIDIQFGFGVYSVLDYETLVAPAGGFGLHYKI
ncbi:MAG: hypothetical protein KDC92_12775 [Bacteroidetes bacterium]|nr:hypothetical protein [Bacteroidota bacterium]